MNRLKTMLAVDMRRLFTTKLFYIFVGIALCIPIAILVMTSSLAGTETTDPQTGEVTVYEGFDSAWQMIGSEVSLDMLSADTDTDAVQADESDAMAMDMTSMCNINLVYMMIGIFICLFAGEDYRSGYAKNLFTVRAKKGDYVASKTIVGLIAGAAMLIAFFIGTLFTAIPFGLFLFRCISIRKFLLSFSTSTQICEFSQPNFIISLSLLPL